MIKAVTFDLWNTLLVERSYTDRRLEILGDALTAEGHRFDPAALRDAYKTAQRRHDDLWSKSHSQYPLAKRLDDILADVDATLSPTKKLEVMDRFGGTILENPPTLTEGAVETVSKMAKVFRLGIISDTGITSGAKISELLDRYGILRFFTARVWSDETGVAKPRRSLRDSSKRTKNGGGGGDARRRPAQDRRSRCQGGRHEGNLAQDTRTRRQGCNARLHNRQNKRNSRDTRGLG